MDRNLDVVALSAAFAQPEMDGTFTGPLGDYLKNISQRRPVLLFAFPPKSAGTFLCTATVIAAGGHLVRAVHAQGGREAQLYLPVFLDYFNGGVCDGPMGVHAHMSARPGNVHFFEALGIRPIIMVRPLPDMLASLSDMFDTEPVSRSENISGAVPEDFPNFSREEKADFLTEIIAPWYVTYFASWFAYAEKAPERVLVLHYADLLKDPQAMTEACLHHVGLNVPPVVVKAACEGVWKARDKVRFNKGIAGRGRDYFSPAHIARMQHMMTHFPVLMRHMNELFQSS